MACNKKVPLIKCFLYNLICQLEYFFLFVKFLLKLLVLKINLNYQDHVL
jgi:hypothetical protein